MAAVVHVQLRALSFSVDHSQPQAESLSIGLSPEKTVLGLGDMDGKSAQPTAPLCRSQDKTRIQPLTGTKSYFYKPGRKIEASRAPVGF